MNDSWSIGSGRCQSMDVRCVGQWNSTNVVTDGDQARYGEVIVPPKLPGIQDKRSSLRKSRAMLNWIVLGTQVS